MDIKYANACTEVFSLLNYFLDEKDFEKIPKEQIEYIKKQSNPEYTYKIDESKELEEQNISKEAKAIILSLYKKYFATKDENLKINRILREKNDIYNKQEYKGFNNINELMEYKKTNENYANNEEIVEKSIVKRENIFSKIINKILNWFKK